MLVIVAINIFLCTRVVGLDRAVNFIMHVIVLE